MEDIDILETFRYRQKTKNYNKISLEDVQAIENLIARNKELESALDNSVSKDEIKAKIEQLDIEISSCEYVDDDPKEYKKDIENEKRLLLRDKHTLQELLNKGE